MRDESPIGPEPGFTRRGLCIGGQWRGAANFLADVHGDEEIGCGNRWPLALPQAEALLNPISWNFSRYSSARSFIIMAWGLFFSIESSR